MDHAEHIQHSLKPQEWVADLMSNEDARTYIKARYQHVFNKFGVYNPTESGRIDVTQGSAR